MELENLRKERLKWQDLVDKTDKTETDKRNTKWGSVCKKVGFTFLFVLVAASFTLAITLCTENIISKLNGSIKRQPLQINLKHAVKIVGSRHHSDIQDCQNGKLKMTFPDIDYALFGYNIIKGYPLAAGSDPGFTYPVFAADYSQKRQTADCRYAVPRGLILAPDVSCVTSFSSKVIKDSQQLSKAISASAQVSGSAWGASFSASTEYQKKSSQMSAGESVFILSTAHCNYYFSELDQVRPPPLSKSFITRAKRLRNETDIIGFIDLFGTHFLKYVQFGARFIYEHKMSKNSFQRENSDGISVTAKASYSSLYSLSAGLGLSKSQIAKAKQFQNQAESSVISVGAPPPTNGKTMEWASKVKDTPVPVKYTLASIEELFSETYMKETNINYVTLQERIKNVKKKYCQELQRNGKVDSCQQVDDYKRFKKISLGSGHYKVTEDSLEMCKTMCLDEARCVAVVYQPMSKSKRRSCFLYQGGLSFPAKPDSKKTEMIIFTDSLKILDKSFRIADAKIVSLQVRDGNKHVRNETICAANCQLQKGICAAYTFKKGSKDKNCFLYRQSQIRAIIYKKDFVAVINPN